MRKIHVLIGLTVAATVLSTPAAQAAEPASPTCVLHYRITPHYERSPRALEVELEFPADDRRETFIRVMPSWAGVDDFAAALTGWHGVGPGVTVAQAELPNRWRVDHPAGGTVRVAYSARAALPDPDDGRPQDQAQMYRTQIGADWFQFFGYGVLPSVEPWGDRTTPRQCVTVLQPGQPGAPAFSSLGTGQGPATEWALQASPERLRHAFYAGGPGWRLAERRLASGPVHTAVRHKFQVEDGRFADEVASLLDAHRRFWGDEQAAPQWVVLTPNFSAGDFGGTLVDHAAVLHAGADFGPGNSAFESLVGHENLHQWIPHRFGSLAEGPAQQVSDYWFSEGFTNYYTHRLLLASALWSLPRYADELTEVLQRYWRSPARNATVASIAPRFFSDRDAGQQLYARGELLAMRWDRILRRKQHDGLDTALKSLLIAPGDAANRPLASDHVLDGLTPWLGEQPRRDVHDFIDEGLDLPLDDAGLAGPCFTLGWRDEPRWVLGFSTDSFADRQVRGVQPDGPAHRAGLRNGARLSSWSIYGGDVSRDVELAIETTDGPPQTLRFKPVDGSSDHLPFVTTRPGAADEAACRAWVRAASPRPSS
ncbi:hypothetical protein [Ideonella sp.]|uniref:M61 family metallopeptidase n=1 Tax=Ideonella sp. TaxID=1929293 RepID=UPI0035AEABBB